MLDQKYINVIRTCLKMARAFGNEKCKSDVEETLKEFDKEMKIDKKIFQYEEARERCNGVQTIPPCNSPAPKAPPRQK